MERVNGVYEAAFSFDGAVGVVTFDTLSVTVTEIVSAFEESTAFRATSRPAPLSQRIGITPDVSSVQISPPLQTTERRALF